MVRRILLIAGAVVLVLLLAGAAFATYTARRAFPQTDGRLQLPGLNGEVVVLRDPMGIPHVYTADEHDLFMAQGFVHAQDRFWQMDFYRHVAAGRLAELFGESGLETDRFLRTLGFERVVSEEYPLLDAPTRAMLDSYAEGVNAFLDLHRGGGSGADDDAPRDVDTGALSLEYSVLWLTNRDYQPDPWRPEDTLLFAKVMAYSLCGNLDQEVARFAMLGSLTRAEVDQLYPAYPVGEKPLIVPDPPALGAVWPAAEGETATAVVPSVAVTTPAAPIGPFAGRAVDTLRRRVAAVDRLLAPVRDGLGSNSWAIAGTRTATGMPFLANDTHLQAQMPSIWYEIGLHQQAVGGAASADGGQAADSGAGAGGGAAGEPPASDVTASAAEAAAAPLGADRFEVVGFSFPGAPGVVIGHNEHLAWGCTNLPADVQDLFIEKLDPADPTRYEAGGRWLQMDTRTEELLVAGGPSETLTVRSTAHGPVISDTYELLSDAVAGGAGEAGGLDEPLPGAYALSLRWTALEPSTLMQAVRQIDLAQTMADFREAARLWDVPSQNLLFASNNGPHGHIGYQTPGKIPVRQAGDGRYPVPGWTGRYDWSGYVPFEELPWALDPDVGYVVTANNAVTAEGTIPSAAARTTPYLAYDWAYGDRASRIVQMIEEADAPLALDDMRRIQADGYDANAAELVPLLLSLDLRPPLGGCADGAGADSAPADDETLVRLEQARGLLRDWDYQTGKDSAPAALFETFWTDLLDRTFADQIPADLFPHGGGQWFLVMRSLLDRPTSGWWDDRSTPGVVEDRDTILRRAFTDAVAELDKAQGKDESRWRWGEQHTITFRNLSLGDSGVWVIERLFNRGPYAVSGTTDAVNANSWTARRLPDDESSEDQPSEQATSSGETSGGAMASDATSSGDRSFETRVLPALRMIVDLRRFDDSLSVHTTGQSGHAFDEHYADMVDLWLAVDYHPMYWDRDAIAALDDSERLELAP